MRAQPAWRFYAPCRSGPILDLTFPPAGSTRAPCSPRYSCRQFRPVLEISKCGPSGTSPRTLPRRTGESRANPKKHVGDDVGKWHTSSELDILWLLQDGVNAYLPVERSRIRRDW